MKPTAGQIIAVLETEVAPPHLAEDWDRAGLCVGDPGWPAGKVWVALDPLGEVVDAAAADGAGLLVVHHPLLFAGIHGVDLSTPAGRVIGRAVENKLAVYAAHTSLDKARGGINELLARKLGLLGCKPLVPSENPEDGFLACVGDIPGGKDLFSLAREIKQRFMLSLVRVAGPPSLQVRRAAVCAGSGGGLLPDFFRSDAQVLVTGDMRYHDARAVEERGRGLIDMGHFASEHLVVEELARTLSALLARRGMEVEVIACRMEKDPFQAI